MSRARPPAARSTAQWTRRNLKKRDETEAKTETDTEGEAEAEAETDPSLRPTGR